LELKFELKLPKIIVVRSHLAACPNFHLIAFVASFHLNFLAWAAKHLVVQKHLVKEQIPFVVLNSA